MRSIRRFTQVVLSVAGVATVGYAVFAIDSLWDRSLVAALGLIVMELGIWQVTRAFFPNDREYKPLRHETDYFLKLVRRLNRAALLAESGSATAREELDQVEEAMHHSVERMRRLAGRTAEELGLEEALVPTHSSVAHRAVESALRARRA
ncbi:MAG: hypothetical protein ACRENP_18080 [Longimicrobiales bacterium]